MPSSILRLAPNFIPATRRRLHSQRSTTIFRSAPQKINRTKAEIKSKLCKLQNGGGGKDISKIVGKSQLAKKTNIPINFILKKNLVSCFSFHTFLSSSLALVPRTIAFASVSSREKVPSS